VQEIADWLDKLGLGQYAQRFAENDISFFILPDLTDQDLEKIGVASLGHRRLLLRAASSFCGVDEEESRLSSDRKLTVFCQREFELFYLRRALASGASFWAVSSQKVDSPDSIRSGMGFFSPRFG
jgi:hypothetical protein